MKAPAKPDCALERGSFPMSDCETTVAWNVSINTRMTELLEHFAGIGRTRPDVAVNKQVGRSGQIFSQSHSGKLRFASEKSELDLSLCSSQNASGGELPLAGRMGNV